MAAPTDAGSLLSEMTLSCLLSKSATEQSRASASAMTKLSTASKKLRAAVIHVHKVLSTHKPTLRRIFTDTDAEREGSAPRDVLKAAIIDAIQLNPRWHAGLDHLFDLADPGRTGSIAFGRLMRLLRTPVVVPTDGTNSSSSPRGTDFLARGDGDEELRGTFAGVNTGDRALLRRLALPRVMPAMPPTVRATNILGDSAVRAPWATAGDDARMNHILISMHAERLDDLRQTLLQHSSPAGRITLRQLYVALKLIDPLLHDAEVRQYFGVIRNDERGAPPDEALQTAEGMISTRFGGTRQTASPRATGRNRGNTAAATISVESFLARFANNVLASPAMRCSATFTMDWSSAATRRTVQPPQTAPSPRHAAERFHKRRLEAQGTTQQPRSLPAPPLTSRPSGGSRGL